MVIARDRSFDEAFDVLFAVAERVARRVAGPSAAEDIAAEVMGRTFARWPRVQALAYREAWVARVAFNESLDVYRRDRRLDGPGTFRAETDPATNSSGTWVASGLHFSKPGCWEITARMHNSTITFRLRVGRP